MAATDSFFGTRVLAATFVLAMFGWGLGFYGPPLYLHAVQTRTGWSVPLVSGAVTAHFLAGTLVVANLSRLYRGLGVPGTTLAGALCLACGILGWSRAAHPAALYVAALVSGAGWVAMGAAAVNALIAPWYVRRRPWALSVAYNGASVGGVLFAPLWAVLISSWGFERAALLLCTLMVAVVAVLAARVYAHTPRSLGQHPDGEAQPAAVSGVASRPDVPDLWRDRRFLTLAAGMSLGLCAQIGLLAHLYSMLAPVLRADVAGWAVGSATAWAIGGRMLAVRLMGPGTDRRRVAGLFYGLQMAGVAVLVLALAHPAVAWVGIALFGLGIGNATSLPPPIAQHEFSARDAARVVPLAVALSQAAYSAAPLAFGALRASGDAGLAFFAAAMLLQALAAASLCWGGRRG